MTNPEATLLLFCGTFVGLKSFALSVVSALPHLWPDRLGTAANGAPLLTSRVTVALGGTREPAWGEVPMTSPLWTNWLCSGRTAKLSKPCALRELFA